MTANIVFMQYRHALVVAVSGNRNRKSSEVLRGVNSSRRPWFMT